MGTITVKIKSTPKLCDLISDSNALYYEYDSAEAENTTVSVSAKKALKIIESGKSYFAKCTCDTDTKNERGQKEAEVDAPENGRYHVCFFDGDKNHMDVLVSQSVFSEHLGSCLKMKGRDANTADMKICLLICHHLKVLI